MGDSLLSPAAVGRNFYRDFWRCGLLPALPASALDQLLLGAWVDAISDRRDCHVDSVSRFAGLRVGRHRTLFYAGSRAIWHLVAAVRGLGRYLEIWLES